jgi:PST family polysaccharide transporter
MRKEIARGAAWMVSFRLLDRAIGIVSTAILARLLLPEDFGVVAMAMSVIGIIELTTAFGFEIALIQKASPERKHYDTAWTLNVLLAIGGTILTFCFAHPASVFYNEPRLAPVMFAVGGAWLVSGFENIGIVNFRRNMDFGSEFRFMAYKRIFTFMVVLVAALALRSYWALVIGTVTGRVLGVILSYLMEPFRPIPSLVASRELFSFSGWVLLSNISGIVIGKIPLFFVGRMFGAQILGVYTVGAEIAQLAHTELVAPINRAMFPGYSRLTGNIDEFRRTCIDATGGILLLVLPASVGIAVIAGPIVHLLLGEKWAAAVPIIQILALGGTLNAIVSNNLAAYVAQGRPNLSAAILLSRLAVLVPALFVFSQRMGLWGVLYAELTGSAVSLIVSYPLLFRQLRIPLGGYLSAIWRPVIASTAMGAAVIALLQNEESHRILSTSIRDLMIGVPAGVLTYFAVLWVLWSMSGRPDSVESNLWRYAESAFRSRVGR